MSASPANSDRVAPTGEAGVRELHEKIDLLALLGRSLHEVGVPAHRLEEMLLATARRCGTIVQVFCLPTGLMLSVEAEPVPVTMLVRSAVGTVQLERMERLLEVVGKIDRGQISVAQAMDSIETIMRSRERWGRSEIVLAYVLSAGAFAVFFGGGMAEVVTSTIVGLAAGLLAIVVRQVGLPRSMFELGAAAIAAVIANGAQFVKPSLVDWIPLAAGLIILLPGLAMVDAIDELAHGHLTSGSARLAGVGTSLLAMAFGTLIGLYFVQVAPDSPPQAEHLGTAATAVALLAVAVGSTIRFRARPLDMWVALAASAVALFGSVLGATWVGQFAGPFLAALLLGVAANAYSALSRQPAQLMTVPGLALLVPGSFGVRSMAALLNEQTELGVDTAFHMFLSAMALVTGLLVSNSLFRQAIGSR